MKCSSHDKPLDIYCETCNDIICSDCNVRYHKGHDYDLINDIYDRHRHAIESNLEPVKEQIFAVTEVVTTLHKERKRSHTRQKQSKKTFML